MNKLHKSINLIIESYHPLHFIASMGVGITSGIMYNFPIKSIEKGMKFVGIIYFFINLVILVINHSLFICKYNKMEKIWKILHEPHLTIYFGASSMSFTTMINMLFFLKPNWKTAIFTLWWINFFQAICCIFFITFFLLSYPTNIYQKKHLEEGFFEHNKLREKNEFLSKVTPAYLLPLVTTTVTSASGALISSIIDGEKYLLSMIIVTFMLFGVAITSSIVFIPIIFTKILTFGLPKFNNSFTMFVPIGIMGQGGFSILLNSINLIRYLKLTNIVNNETQLIIIDKIIKIQGLGISILFLSFGILLTIWGILTIGYWYIGWPNSYHNNKKKHNKVRYWTPTMWAATFPFGTISLSSLEIYKITNIRGFQILSTIYGFTVIIITTWCMIGTLVYVIPWKGIYRVISGDEDETK